MRREDALDRQLEQRAKQLAEPVEANAAREVSEPRFGAHPQAAAGGPEQAVARDQRSVLR
jgi:hypothetical protein